MANTAKPITSYNACTAPAGTDVLVGVSATSGQTVKIPVDSVLNNSTVNAIGTTFVRLGDTTTPANNADIPAGAVNNSIWSDGDYIYYYDGVTIKRAALTSF